MVFWKRRRRRNFLLREGDRLEDERGGYDVKEPRKGWQGRPKFEES